jgi:hypothetical protein
MKERIKESINQPEVLEKLYHEDRKYFESSFQKIYSEIESTEMARFWKVRLDYIKPQEISNRFLGLDIFILVITCLITGFLINLPKFFTIDLEEFLYYEKNAGIIVFLGLTIYAIWINKIFNIKELILITLAFLIPIIYINFLPTDKNSQSLNLAYLHLPLFMWCIYGLVFIEFNTTDKRKRIDYIKYNGDLAILGAIILIAGAILTGITIGLFSAIDINIENFYQEYVVIWGLVSAPIVATYIIQNYPTLTNKIAPIIASIFSPLVLLTLVIYLITIPISGKNPYDDRNFLLIFNMMLLGVMGIIVFSVSETSLIRKQKFNEMILFFLSIITLVIDMVALSAIFYRLGEYGITPNRLAVLGSNILIFVNLVLIMIDLYKVNFKKSEIGAVELTISKYLPIYALWTLIVIFGFPILFGMK